MKFIEKSFIQIKEYQRIIFSLIFYFSFEDFIISNYQKYIVNKFLVFFSSSLITEIVFYLIIFSLFVWAISKYKKGFYFKPNTIVYSVIFLIFYTYIRIHFVDALRSLKSVPVINYSDLLYFIFGTFIFLQIILLVKRKKSLFVEEMNFYIDTPIQNSSEDTLNRKEQALQVARFLKNNYSHTSIAIGIVGRWGDGKTSFMSLIEESFTDM